MNAIVEKATAEVIEHPASATPNPAQLLAIAVQQGADLDRLERLMALQERWETGEARKAFVAAMAAFKAEPLVIFKRKQVGYTTKEGEFVGYTHAELSDITDVVSPAMGRHGLSYRWDIDQREGRIHVTCIVTHARGHSEQVTMDAPPDASGKKNTIQQIASATTYLQRYTLLAATGMSTKGMDDDARAAEADAKEGERSEKADARQTLIDQGQAEAMRGMKALTKWWGTLNARQRNDLNKEFGAMRRAAAAAERGVNHEGENQRG